MTRRAFLVGAAVGAVVKLAALAWWLSTAPTVLRWDPVTRDRFGGLEPGPVVYLVHVWRAEIRGWQIGVDGEPYPVYDRWSEDVRLTETSMPLPDPAPGNVIAWSDPVAVDAAGNRSDAP